MNQGCQWSETRRADAHREEAAMSNSPAMLQTFSHALHAEDIQTFQDRREKQRNTHPTQQPAAEEKS